MFIFELLLLLFPYSEAVPIASVEATMGTHLNCYLMVDPLDGTLSYDTYVSYNTGHWVPTRKTHGNNELNNVYVTLVSMCHVLWYIIIYNH